MVRWTVDNRKKFCHMLTAHIALAMSLSRTFANLQSSARVNCGADWVDKIPLNREHLLASMATEVTNEFVTSLPFSMF